MEWSDEYEHSCLMESDHGLMGVPPMQGITWKQKVKEFTIRAKLDGAMS